MHLFGQAIWRLVACLSEPVNWLVRWQGKGGGSELILGTFAALCYLARQITVIPFLVYIALELRSELRGRGRASWLAPLAAPLIIAVVAHHIWLHHVHGLPYWAAQSFLHWPSLGSLHRLTSMLVCVPLQLAPLCAGLIGPARIGITAGASTPNSKIGEAVVRILATRGLDLPDVD